METSSSDNVPDSELESERESEPESDTESEDAGAVVMWFGKHEGIQMEQLNEEYRWCLIENHQINPTAPNLVKFKALYEKYTTQCDKRQSPMSMIVWWEKFNKGREIRHIHQSKRTWRWFISRNNVRSRALLSIEERWKVWRSKRSPRKRYTQTQPRIVANPVGEKIRYTDGFSVDVGEYESDDGFVVLSDEDEGENEHDLSSGMDIYEGCEPVDDLGYESELDVEAVDLDLDGYSSSYSLPSLNELLGPRVPKGKESPRTLITPSCSTSPAANPQDVSSPIFKSGHRQSRKLQSRSQMERCTPSFDSSSDSSSEPVMNSVIRKKEVSISSQLNDVNEDTTESDGIIVSSFQENKRKALAMSQATQSKIHSTTSSKPNVSRKRQKIPTIILGSEEDSDNLPLIPQLLASARLKRTRQMASSSDMEEQATSSRKKVLVKKLPSRKLGEGHIRV